MPGVTGEIGRSHDVDKYARVMFPHLVSERTRIKQPFTPSSNRPRLPLFYPPKWGVNDRLVELLGPQGSWPGGGGGRRGSCRRWISSTCSATSAHTARRPRSPSSSAGRPIASRPRRTVLVDDAGDLTAPRCATRPPHGRGGSRDPRGQTAGGSCAARRRRAARRLPRPAAVGVPWPRRDRRRKRQLGAPARAAHGGHRRARAAPRAPRDVQTGPRALGPLSRAPIALSVAVAASRRRRGVQAPARGRQSLGNRAGDLASLLTVMTGHLRAGDKPAGGRYFRHAGWARHGGLRRTSSTRRRRQRAPVRGPLEAHPRSEAVEDQ